MASFSISNFENETSIDFLSDVVLNGYGLISITLDKILDTEYRPDLLECEEALLAAEFVAKAKGNPAHDFPEEAQEWFETYLPGGSAELREVAGLAEKAADAIDIIVTDSELRDLWEDQPEFNQWFEAQVALQKRILE